MVINKVQELLESNNAFLTLQKEEISDQEFMKLLAIKPSEINTLLARAVDFIKDAHPGQTKRDVIIEMLKILARSIVARKFIGMGMNQNYRLFKGYPVRRGDPQDKLPAAGTEITLQTLDTFINWTTDATKGREIGAKFDATKGDPVGGLLVEGYFDPSKIYIDINAIMRTVRTKKALIDQYNISAAPGKAISKANTTYLSTDAQVYKGEYEVVTPSKFNHVRVNDVWTWNGEGSGKVVKWQDSDKADTAPTPKSDSEENKKEEPSQSSDKEKEAMTESATSIESDNDILDETIINDPDMKAFWESSCVSENDSIMDEAFGDWVKKGMNFVSKTLGVTIRGKSLRYYDLLLKQYNLDLKRLQLAKQYLELSNDDEGTNDPKISLADKEIQKTKLFIEKTKDYKDELEQNTNKDINFNRVNAGPSSELNIAEGETK